MNSNNIKQSDPNKMIDGRQCFPQGQNVTMDWQINKRDCSSIRANLLSNWAPC